MIYTTKHEARCISVEGYFDIKWIMTANQKPSVTLPFIPGVDLWLSSLERKALSTRERLLDTCRPPIKSFL